MPYTILNKDLFAKIKGDKGAVIDFIKKEIKEKNLPLPIERPSEENANKSYNAIRSQDYTNILKKGEWFTRYDYKIPFDNYYIDLNRDGLEASDYFTYEARMNCDSINSPSPMRVWESDKFMNSLLGSIFTLKHTEVTSNTLKTSMALRKYISSQFRPSAAKCLYQTFNAKNVLDFSAGWGDRLIGALATDTVESYTGVDPSQTVFEKYSLIHKSYNVNKKVDFICAPAEDVDYGDRKFDFIFSSPPYFNIERYSKEKNQSWQRYKKINDWLTQFLFKALENLWHTLEPNGILAVNISDVYSNHIINKMCDPMHDFIGALDNANFIGCIGYRMQKRINSKSNKSGVFCEPVWIWQKGTKNKLDDFFNI